MARKPRKTSKERREALTNTRDDILDTAQGVKDLLGGAPVEVSVQAPPRAPQEPVKETKEWVEGVSNGTLLVTGGGILVSLALTAAVVASGRSGG